MPKKKVLQSILLCLVMIATMFLMVPQIGLADSPPDELAPVYPPGEPPLQAEEGAKMQEAQVIVPDGDGGIRATSYMFYNAENPYKSGTSAKGEAWTSTNYIPFVWKHVYADAWLWKWEGGERVQVAHDRGVAICPPTCSTTAIASYANAESAYYCVTSRHEVWANNEPLHYAEDYSASVWLSF